MKMPVIFLGHGSPMLALEKNDVANGLHEIGEKILDKYGRPKAILMVSAHWYVGGTFIQTDPEPRQVYDMYGFPQELYEVKYEPKGCADLSGRVSELLGGSVSVNNEWGIDHGTWTTLVHVFPDASVPVVQLSVNKNISERECFEIGKKLSLLREEGYLIMANGNIVHNLSMVQWDNNDGTPMCKSFNEKIISLVEGQDIDALIDYKNLPDWKYAVPTPDHYLPLLYCLGAADSDVDSLAESDANVENVTVFNNICDLGSMAMTSFAFGL